MVRWCCAILLDVLLDLDGQVLVVDPEATLLGDFWKTVDVVLREKGVIP